MLLNKLEKIYFPALSVPDWRWSQSTWYDRIRIVKIYFMQ